MANPTPNPARTERIRQLRAEGQNLTQVGITLNLSRERIRQICNNAGIPTRTPRVIVPLTCSRCGEPYDPPGDRKDAVYGGAREHLNRTGHHTQPRKHQPWTPNERMQTFLSLRQQNPNLPIAQISRAVGVTSSYASWYLRRVGLASSYHAERDAKIIEAWQAGDTYAVIQEKFRLCYQRVRQIIAGYLGSGEMPKASTRRKETHDD